MSRTCRLFLRTLTQSPFRARCVFLPSQIFWLTWGGLSCMRPLCYRHDWGLRLSEFSRTTSTPCGNSEFHRPFTILNVRALWSPVLWFLVSRRLWGICSQVVYRVAGDGRDQKTVISMGVVFWLFKCSAQCCRAKSVDRLSGSQNSDHHWSFRCWNTWRDR